MWPPRMMDWYALYAFTCRPRRTKIRARISPGVAMPWPAAPPIPSARSSVRTDGLPFGAHVSLCGWVLAVHPVRQEPGGLTTRAQSCAEHGVPVKECGSFGRSAQGEPRCLEGDRALSNQADRHVRPLREIDVELSVEVARPGREHQARRRGGQRDLPGTRAPGCRVGGDLGGLVDLAPVHGDDNAVPTKSVTEDQMKHIYLPRRASVPRCRHPYLTSSKTWFRR